MIITTKNNRQVLLRLFHINDIDLLLVYLDGLSTVTKCRFGPHGFDRHSVIDFYKPVNNVEGFIGIDIATGNMVTYAVVKKGFLLHDQHRLESYGIKLNAFTDATYAPSVADEWQGIGIGNMLYQFIVNHLKSYEITRIILWGGVQAANEKAVLYYKRNGFKELGIFEYNGSNIDMIALLT